jgi:hypothetical protein
VARRRPAAARRSHTRRDGRGVGAELRLGVLEPGRLLPRRLPSRHVMEVGASVGRLVRHPVGTRPLRASLRRAGRARLAGSTSRVAHGSGEGGAVCIGLRRRAAHRVRSRGHRRAHAGRRRPHRPVAPGRGVGSGRRAVHHHPLQRSGQVRAAAVGKLRIQHATQQAVVWQPGRGTRGVGGTLPPARPPGWPAHRGRPAWRAARWRPHHEVRVHSRRRRTAVHVRRVGYAGRHHAGRRHAGRRHAGRGAALRGQRSGRRCAARYGPAGKGALRGRRRHADSASNGRTW